MVQNNISNLFNSAAVQIVRMRNAHWVLPFLLDVFKTDQLFSVSEHFLIPRLAEELRSHSEGTEDLEEANIFFGEDEETRARKYLQHWVQRRLLQDFPDAEAVTQYQLSAHTEKVFQWFQTLEKRQFVGTESRFRFLFQTLQEVVEFTQDNRTTRLEELKNKRAEIEKEIKNLEYGGQISIYSNAQVQERLDWFTRLGHELLSDFREVEDNFKSIHRNIVEQHTKAEINKGAIVSYAFEAYNTLRNSDQGKSFYTFWDFLISRAGQEDWRHLTETLLQVLDDRKIETDTSFLQNIKSMLLQHGRSVYEANDKMAEKLSRIIAEKEITRHKRLRQQINSIKESVLQLLDDNEVPCHITLQESMTIRLNMERKLILHPKQAPAEIKQPGSSIEKIEDIARFSRLLNHKFIDKKVLWQRVENVLEIKKTATLKEVIEHAGLENGMAEVISYFGFLRDKNVNAQTLDITELIPLNPEQTQFVEVPYLLFSK